MSNWTSVGSPSLICRCHSVKKKKKKILLHHIMSVNLYSPCRNASTMSDRAINRNWMMTKKKAMTVLSENVNVFSFIQILLHSNFKCHVFLVCHRGREKSCRCNTRRTSDHEQSGCKSSQSCRFRIPTQQTLVVTLSIYSYKDDCLGLCRYHTANVPFHILHYCNPIL